MAELEYGGSRAPTPAEQQLLAAFAKIEEAALATLDEGAKQVIQLATGLLGLLLGALALGADTFAQALQAPLVKGCAILAVIALLVALLVAGWALLPQPYTYRRASLSDKARDYEAILAHKANGMYAAFVAFGVGVISFALLLILLLLQR
ncbi:MAG: hypothetical protein DYG89_23975 [Caldilinea sp. CFX5]|nr:hypothetical protein [Caldilinea sp. CFX5]